MNKRPSHLCLCLAALLGLSGACAGGSKVAAPDLPWRGATALTATEDYPAGVVVDGTNVLFTTGLTQVGDHAVRIAPLTPDPATPAVSRILVADPGGTTPNGTLAVGGGDVYVAAGSGVKRVSVATGEVTPVVDGRPTGVKSVAVDDRFVWWTTSEFQSPEWAEVARIPKSGGAVEILAAGTDAKGHVFQDDPARKAVAVSKDSSSFYSLVLDGDDALVPSPAAILRVGPGQKPQVVVDDHTLGGTPTRIAADSDHIYAELAGGDLVSVPRTGGSPTKLAFDPDDTKDIAVAGNEVVFFTHLGDGGNEELGAVPTTGGAVRTVTAGHNPDGDLAVSGILAVFSADSRVWSVPLRGP